MQAMRQRAEHPEQRLPQDDSRVPSGFRRARPGDYSYIEELDWIIILFRTNLIGPCCEQALGVHAISTRRQGMLIDIWPMPTDEPDEVLDALDRIRTGRQNGQPHDDVGPDGKKAPEEKLLFGK